MISGILVHLMALNCYNDVSRSCDTKWPPYVAKHFNPGEVGQDHVNPDFADSALLLPLNLYGEREGRFVGLTRPVELCCRLS